MTEQPDPTMALAWISEPARMLRSDPAGRHIRQIHRDEMAERVAMLEEIVAHALAALSDAPPSSASHTALRLAQEYMDRMDARPKREPANDAPTAPTAPTAP